MIEFFRRIRRRSLTENKFSKYLLYAIGEIILVVLGILIALSINNWNDHRKDRIAEKELYKTLIKSLESDLENVRARSTTISSAMLAQEIFIAESFEEVRLKYTNREFSSLLSNVGYTSYSFVPNISLYTKISQNGQIELIQSDELQKKVIELYDRHYWEYKDLDNTLERQAHSGLISNFFGNISHLFTELESFQEWEQVDLEVDLIKEHYDELSKDCRKIYFLSLAVKNSMLNCENKIEALLPLLKDELNK